MNASKELSKYEVETLAHFGTKLTERNSLIIFDEVQMFPQARAAIKYLVADAQKAIKAKNDGKTEARTK